MLTILKLQQILTGKVSALKGFIIKQQRRKINEITEEVRKETTN